MSAPRLEDQIRTAIRERHYSLRTEEAYVMWFKQFVRFHGLRHPKEMGREEVTAFLKHLSVERDVAVGTHRQARNAVLVFFRQGGGRGVGEGGGWGARRA